MCMNDDNNMIRALYVPCDDVPEIVFLSYNNLYEELREYVGDYDYIPILHGYTGENVDLVFNERHKESKPFNRYLRMCHFTSDYKDTSICDYICGDFLIVAVNENEKYTSISDKSILYWQGMFFNEEKPIGIGCKYIDNEKSLDFLDNELFTPNKNNDERTN